MKWFVAAMMIGLLVVAAIYWDAARKEVVFLCQNFTPGVTASSVMRQLDTITVSHVEVEALETGGKRIVLSSDLNFNMYRCVIHIGELSTVTSAGLE